MRKHKLLAALAVLAIPSSAVRALTINKAVADSAEVQKTLLFRCSCLACSLTESKNPTIR